LPLRRLRGDFMLRSEKRPGFPNKRRSRGRMRSRARFFYAFSTLIMLAAVFPVGAVMLWRRRLRWRGYVKLAVMCVGLCAFFVIASLLVTIPVENRLVSQAQSAARDALNKAQTAIFDAASRAGRNFIAVWSNAPQIAMTVYKSAGGSAVYAAKSIILSADSAVRGPAAVVTDPPPIIETPETTAEPTVSVPPVTSTAASRTPGLTVSPTATPKPTPKPTMNPALLPKIKPMGETTVWFTSDGRWYHKDASCGTMRGAKRHTLNEAIRQKKTRCPYCEPPPPEAASVLNGVWVDDTSRVFHITDECELLGSNWTAKPAADAAANGYTPCEECGAYHYIHNLAFYNAPPLSKSAGGATTDNPNTVVFVTEKSVFYHASAGCQALNMMSPSTILDAVNSDLKPCSICGAVTYDSH